MKRVREKSEHITFLGGHVLYGGEGGYCSMESVTMKIDNNNNIFTVNSTKFYH